MIRFANENDLNEIKSLWKECFGDSEEYIQFFFSNHNVEKETLVYTIESKVVGMLNLLPATIKMADGYKPIRYVYAVGTLKNYRGRGIARDLLNYANQELNKIGVTTVLVPASQTLFDYYKKQGYQTIFYMSEKQQDLSENASSVSATSINEFDTTENIRIEDITPYEYKKLRDEHFEELGYVSWGIESIGYAIEENQLLGGETKKVLLNEKPYIVMYYVQEDTIVIKESTIPELYVPYVFQSILQNKSYSQIKIRSSKEVLSEGMLRPFGMIYNNVVDSQTKYFTELNNKAGYINLVLD